MRAIVHPAEPAQKRLQTVHPANFTLYIEFAAEGEYAADTDGVSLTQTLEVIPKSSKAHIKGSIVIRKFCRIS